MANAVLRTVSWFISGNSWSVDAGRAALLFEKRGPFRVKGLEEASHISHTLRIGRGQRGGTLGLRRIDPDGVDLLLGLLGDVADHRHLALPAAREQRAGLSKVEAGDVTLLVIGLGRNAEQLGGGVV